jgi:hypothetical protein
MDTAGNESSRFSWRLRNGGKIPSSHQTMNCENTRLAWCTAFLRLHEKKTRTLLFDDQRPSFDDHSKSKKTSQLLQGNH